MNERASGTVRARSLAVWKALTTHIGPDEFLLVAALVLVTAGLWPIAVRWIGAGRAALVVPGLVVLWIALPSRLPFIVRADVAERASTKRP